MKKWISIALSALILIGGGISFYQLDHVWSRPAPAAAASSKLGQPGEVHKAEAPASLKDLIREDQKKVVSIQVTTPEDGMSTGSGFLYNGNGDIITNAHVVEDAINITVKTYDTSLHPGKLIGIDTKKDVALIRVEALAGQEPLKLNTKTEVEVGDEVLAFGSPLGFDNTVTTGIISGVNRDVEADVASYHNVYQISAPITHGNSGGPLVLQSNGQVIGINSAGSDAGTIGFSIPIGQVKEMIEKWSQHPDEKLAKETSSGETASDGYTKESLGSDAKYLVEYFYECLNQGDYVTAYSLLGSDWQTKSDYKQFRNGYLNTLGVTVTKSSVQSATVESAQVNAVITAKEKDKDGNTVEHSYSLTYTVKLENDKLKIASGKGKKL